MNQTKKYIYADNAATTQLDPVALEAMLPFLKGEFANPSSPYSFSRNAKRALQESREIIAGCINALPEEIFFTSGGSESNNWAIKHFIFCEFHRKRRILISPFEHHAILNTCVEATKRFGFSIITTPVDSQGNIIMSEYLNNISEHIDGISIMLANNEIGTIEDISALVNVAREYKIPFHTDAIQAVGHISVDVKNLGVDMLSASAHKFYGPKGIGFLFVRKGMPMVNFINGGQQEFGHRAGTENVASIVGMAIALKHSCQLMRNSTTRIKKMEQSFVDYIQSEIPAAVFSGNSKAKLPGYISFSIPGISGEALLHVLDLKGISVATGAACNSHSTEISHVLKTIGLTNNLANGTLRISFGHNNDEDDPLNIAREIISYCKRII